MIFLQCKNVKVQLRKTIKTKIKNELKLLLLIKPPVSEEENENFIFMHNSNPVHCNIDACHKW